MSSSKTTTCLRSVSRIVRIAMALCVPMFLGCQTMATHSLSMSNSAIDGEEYVELFEPHNAVDKHGLPVEMEVSDLNESLPPAELRKMSLPRYRIEPPDVLIIQGIRMAPKAPYYIETLDILQIVVDGVPPEQPIAGTFQVEPNGTVNLGPAYGHVKIVGKSTREAEDAIQQHLSLEYDMPAVAVSLLQSAAQQIIAGEHLVAPDGYINLGKFGSVYVSGMTIDEATNAVQEKLSDKLDDPIVSVDVFTYNSKNYYVIVEGAGFGNSIIRLPATGNETVLDALATVGGTQRVSNTSQMWIARPAPHDANCRQILPIDYEAIVKHGSVATNYQILPGDRLYIGEDRLIALNTTISKILDPVERMFGFTLLGAQTIQTLQRFPRGFRQGGF